MARPRTPTAMLEQRGAFAKDPARGRAREDELQVEAELGPCPEELTKEEKQAWKEIVERSQPGVLKAGDEFIVELAAGLIAERREKRHGFSKASQMASVLAQLGLTPAGRSLVRDPKKDKPPAPKGFAALRQGLRP